MEGEAVRSGRASGTHRTAYQRYAGSYGLIDLKDAAKRVNSFDGGIGEGQRIAARMLERSARIRKIPAPVTLRKFSWEDA